jgi:DNA-binding IclR family transcriptional regulator
MPTDSAEHTDTVLGKAVLILRAFGVDDRVLGLAELVRRTALHKATTYRLAGALVDIGLLDKVDGGYRLSGALFELGMRASVERRLLELAMPFLHDLYQRTHEIVHLGVLEGHEVVYIAKIVGHRPATSPSRLGGRMPLHCTAIGKAMLAHAEPCVRRAVLNGELERRTPRTVVAPGLLHRQLRDIAATGVAYEREESALGILCIAAPVLGPDDRALAAVSVTGPVGRFNPDRHVDALRGATAALAATIARSGTV